MVKVKQLTFLIFCTFFTLNSYGQDRAKQNPKIDIRKDDNCMLNGNFGTPLSIENHEKSNTKITHTVADFIQFNQDGTYKESFGGKECIGTWTYDSKSQTVTTVCKETKTWSVTKIKTNLLELNSNGEKIQLLNKI